MDRQQENDPAAEDPQNEVQLGDQVPERPRRRDDGEVQGVEPLNAGFLLGRRHPTDAFVGPELADESVVDDVRRAGIGGVHVQHRVRARRPDGAGGALLQKETLGLEMARLAEGDIHREAVFLQRVHGDVEPVAAERRLPQVHTAHDFATGDRGVAEVGAQPGGTPQAGRDAQTETDHVSAEMHPVLPGGRLLDQVGAMLHRLTGGIRESLKRSIPQIVRATKPERKTCLKACKKSKGR